MGPASREGEGNCGGVCKETMGAAYCLRGGGQGGGGGDRALPVPGSGWEGGERKD